MTRRSKMFLGLDVVAFSACLVFLVDNYFALRRVYPVWGDNDELGWVRHPLTSITWPPFLGKEHSIPQDFVTVAFIGCIISLLIFLGFFIAWIRKKGMPTLLQTKAKAL